MICTKILGVQFRHKFLTLENKFVSLGVDNSNKLNETKSP